MITHSDTTSTQDQAWWAYAAFVQSDDLPAKLKSDLRLTEVQLKNMARRVVYRPYLYWHPDHQHFELNSNNSSLTVLGRGIPMVPDDEDPYLSMAEMVRDDLSRAIDFMMTDDYKTGYVFCRPDGDRPLPINCYTAAELREMILSLNPTVWKVAQSAINDYMNLVPTVTYRSTLVVTQDLADALAELINRKQIPATYALVLLMISERYAADKSLLNLILRQIQASPGVDAIVAKGFMAEIWARK